MSSLLSVIRFTFLNRFRSRSFLISTLIFVLILSLLVHLPGIITSFSSKEAPKVGLLPSGSEIGELLRQYFVNQEEPLLTIVPIADQGSAEANEAMAKEMIAGKEIKGYLELKPGGDFPVFTYKSPDAMDFTVRSRLDGALQQIRTELAVRDVGLTQAELNRLFAPVVIDTVQISVSGDAVEGKSESEMAMAFMLVYVLLLLLYMGVIGYGNLVATEITMEKSSRVMEVLISSVSPLKQMFGKIIGICLLGLLQIAVFIAVGALNVALSSNKELLENLNVNLSDLPLSLLLYFLVFYVLGYLIYATVFAAVGSLVSRTEDVQQAIMPLTLLIVAGFLIAMFGLNNPNATFIVVMSYVPFFTPLIMFLRIGMGDPAVWEIWLSIAVLAGSIVALGWLAAKIYRAGVLMYGKRPSFKELRKAMRALDV